MILARGSKDIFIYHDRACDTVYNDVAAWSCRSLRAESTGSLGNTAQ